MPDASGALWGPARKKWAPKIKVSKKESIRRPDAWISQCPFDTVGSSSARGWHVSNFPQILLIIQRFKHCHMKEKTDTERFRSLHQTALFSLKMKGPREKIWSYISPQFQKISHQSWKALSTIHDWGWGAERSNPTGSGTKNCAHIRWWIMIVLNT